MTTACLRDGVYPPHAVYELAGRSLALFKSVSSDGETHASHAVRCASWTAPLTRFRLWAPAARPRRSRSRRSTAAQREHAACASRRRLVRSDARGGCRHPLRATGSTAASSFPIRRRASIPTTSTPRAASSIRKPTNGATPAGGDGRGKRRSSTSCTSERSRAKARSQRSRSTSIICCDLGVTAIELMPVADFPGRRNWGYDGVLPFAPDASYGTPDDLKRLVDDAHARGLMVLLDVVYNHFGPEGNYLHAYAPQFFNRSPHDPVGRGDQLRRRGQPQRARLLHPQRALLARGVPFRRAAARRRARDRRRLATAT